MDSISFLVKALRQLVDVVETQNKLLAELLPRVDSNKGEIVPKNTVVYETIKNKKTEATKLTDDRETLFVHFMNGVDISMEAFSCTKHDLEKIRADLSPALNFRKVGSLGSHHDGTYMLDGSVKKYEIKNSEKVIDRDILYWKPWEGGVQFVQSQFKSKAAQTFLNCDSFYRTWYVSHVQPFLARHPDLEIADITYDDYFKVSTSLDAHKKGASPAAKLLLKLRANPMLQGELQQEWLRFEEHWMPENPLNHNAFYIFLKSVLEEKDIWFNINKSGAFIIEGFNVKTLEYDGYSKKPHGGIVYNYTIGLQKKSGGTIKHVKIVYKYTWKNGGQAIQNLNFLVG